MSHELRTPLNAILGFTQLLQADTAPAFINSLTNRLLGYKFARIGQLSQLEKMQAHSELESLLHGKRPGKGLGFFATHPRTTDWVARATEVAGSGRESEPIVARDIYLDKIDDMLYGDDADQGLVQGRRFVHPAIGFEFTVPVSFSILNGERSVTAQGPESAGMRFDFDRPRERLTMVDYIRRVWAADAHTGRIVRLTIGDQPAATTRLRVDREGRGIDIRLSRSHSMGSASPGSCISARLRSGLSAEVSTEPDTIVSQTDAALR